MLQNQNLLRVFQAPINNFPERTFQTIKQLGQGGEGSVFLAKSSNWGSNDNIQFALKFQQYTHKEEIDFISALITYQNNCEISRANQQQNSESSGLIRIYDRFTWMNYHVLVMEIGEIDLYKYLNQQNSIRFDEKLKILLQLSLSINYLHKQKLLHRDIKPENFVKVGNEFKLIDYGLIKSDQQKFKTQQVGTVLYLAPEIVENRSDYTIAVDIWSLGCVFYEVLTKQSLFIENQWVKQQILSCKSDKAFLINKINQIQENEMIKSLLRQMLEPNVQQRIQINKVVEILQELQANSIQMNQQQQFKPIQNGVKMQLLQDQKMNMPNPIQFQQQLLINSQEILSFLTNQFESKFSEFIKNYSKREQNNEDQFNIIQEQINKMQHTIETQLPSKDLIIENSKFIKEQFNDLHQQQCQQIDKQQFQINEQMAQIERLLKEISQMNIINRELEEKIKEQLEQNSNFEKQKLIQKSQSDQEIQKLKGNVQQLQNEIIQLQNTIQEKSNQVQSLELQNNQLFIDSKSEIQEIEKSNQDKVSNYKDQVQQKEEQIKQLEDDLKKQKKENSNLKEEIQQYQQQIEQNKIESQSKIQNIDDQIKKLKDEKQRLENEIEEQKENYEKQQQQNQVDQQQLAAQIQDKQHKNEALTSKLQQSQENVINIQNQQLELQKDIQNKDQEIKSKEDEIQQLRIEKDDFKQKNNDLESKIKELDEQNQQLQQQIQNPVKQDEGQTQKQQKQNNKQNEPKIKLCSQSGNTNKQAFACSQTTNSDKQYQGACSQNKGKNQLQNLQSDEQDRNQKSNTQIN